MENIARQVSPVNSADELTVANAQLHRLRLQRQEKGRSVSAEKAKTPNPTMLPPHLGWGGERVPTQPATTPKPQHAPLEIAIIPDVDDAAKTSAPARPQTLAIHPSLLVAFLKNEVVAIGRIWLLARCIDQHGRGWLTVEALRQQLTDKSSPLRVCGWRRLRQILTVGKGRFWERDHLGRIWLYGTIRVARNLNVTHFSGDAISLPIADLLGTVGDLRATFYTAFHCGRESNPISRATLNKVTSVPERTQRHYDSTHQTERLSNFSLVADAGDQDAAWQHGRATFTFTDNLGKHGTVGKRYTATRLPNSYQTTRYARLAGKRKRLNHKLKQDLVNHGTQGNSLSNVQQLFFSDGQQAARALTRNHDVYLRDALRGSVMFWTGWMQ